MSCNRPIFFSKKYGIAELRIADGACVWAGAVGRAALMKCDGRRRHLNIGLWIILIRSGPKGLFIAAESPSREKWARNMEMGDIYILCSQRSRPLNRMAEYASEYICARINCRKRADPPPHATYARYESSVCTKMYPREGTAPIWNRLRFWWSARLRHVFHFAHPYTYWYFNRPII